MNKNLITVQKKIGFLISLVGFLAIIDNFIHDYSQIHSISVIFTDPAIWLLFLTILPFLLSILIESKLMKIIQITLILFTGFMSMLQS